MPVSYKRLPRALVFQNAVGKWAIWTQPTFDQNSGRYVGPGYIGRVTLPSGKVLVDDYRRDSTSAHVNDPTGGGLGCFGIHLARRNQYFPTDPPNFAWDLTGRMNADDWGHFGVAAVAEAPIRQTKDWIAYRISVDLTDGESHPWPLFTVTYDYLFRPASVDCDVTVKIHDVAGSPLFVKEPKLVAHCLRGYTQIDVLGPNDKLLDRRDLTLLPDPSHGTFQMGQIARQACVLRGAGLPTFRVDCDRGLERWADQADGAEPLQPDGARYCLSRFGRLKRQWESAHWRAKPWAGVMLHAWEGGSGAYDCFTASRAVGPPREHRARLTYTLG